MNSILDYALDVEQITTAKRSNLILNVDGAIAVAFVDLLRESGQFSREEADKYVLLNLFMTARSFIFFFIYKGIFRLSTLQFKKSSKMSRSSKAYYTYLSMHFLIFTFKRLKIGKDRN